MSKRSIKKIREQKEDELLYRFIREERERIEKTKQILNKLKDSKSIKGRIFKIEFGIIDEDLLLYMGFTGIRKNKLLSLINKGMLYDELYLLYILGQLPYSIPYLMKVYIDICGERHHGKIVDTVRINLSKTFNPLCEDIPIDALSGQSLDEVKQMIDLIKKKKKLWDIIFILINYKD